MNRTWIVTACLLAGVCSRAQTQPVPPYTNLLPNGGFEFWARPLRRGADKAEAAVPLRWDVSAQGASIRPAEEARSGGKAVAVLGAAGRELSMRFLEVYPGVPYRFGAWARGQGKVSVRIDGVVIEGSQRLAEASGAAGEDWTHVGGEFSVPRHVLDRIIVTVTASGDLSLDDVHVSARLAEPYDADAVLRDKPRRDEQTLLLEDFDGQASGYTIEGKSDTGVTDPKGGRFGRGLRVRRPGLTVFPVTLKAMPPEGTLEWWITREDFDKVVLLSLTAGRGKAMAQFAGIANLWCQLPGAGTLDVPNAWFGEQARDGQWAHVAVTWDQDFYRVYVNGVLAVRSTQPPKWPAAPTTLQVGSAREQSCWNGALDELRLSSIRRYGPPVPAGFTPFPPLKPEVAATNEPSLTAVGPVAARPYDAKALAAERGKLPWDVVAPTQPGAFEKQPDGTGAYVYEATSLRPLVDALPFEWKTSAAGLVTAALRTIRMIGGQYTQKYNRGAYWTLAMPEGEYGLELLHTQSGVAVYLNGRVVQMTSAGESLRTGPSEAFRPLRSAGAVRLLPGDEIAVMASTPYARDCHVARLRLAPGGIARGRHYVGPHYDPHTGGPDTALAVTGQILFYGRDGTMLPSLLPRDGGRNQRATGAAELETAADGRPAVRCELFNPLPTAVEVEYSVALRSYYRLPVGGETARIRLAPHTAWRKLLPFDALPDERAYSAELKVKVVEPKDEGAWRAAMRWPALDWIEFFPGLRQGMPWPEPFADYDLRRLEFSEPVKAVRRTVLLDGDEGWQVFDTRDWKAQWPAAEELQWQMASVPFKGRKLKPGEPRPHVAFLKRTFVLPADAADQSVEVCLNRTAHEAAIYVNDREVGRVRGGNTPLWADATASARVGTNTLVIVLRDALAIMNPDYVNPAAPVPNLEYLDAPGHYDAEALQCSGVSLRMSPRVSARDLQVITSTRQKTLRTRFAVVNHRDRTLKLKVRARVFDGDRPVFEAGEREVEVAAGTAAPVEFAKPWPEARWWWPFDPHLYAMHVELLDAATGARLDLLRERFGFRESWIDGPHMMFNGMVIRPKGSWLGYREAPNHFARGVEGSGGADWCDERGMMGGTYITALGNTSSRHNVERDAFWVAAEANALQAAREWVNHPSIARWDMSNEWLIYLHGGNPEQGADRFKKLSDAVRAFDPTRWTTFGAEGDVRGRTDHFDFHYMNPYQQNLRGYERMRGVNAYFPDGEFWRELSKDDIPPEGVRAAPLKGNLMLRPREKMVFNREFLWKSGSLMRPNGTVEYLGERCLAWSAWDSASGAALWMWKQKTDGNRDLGVSLINHYTHPGLKRRALAHQTLIVPEVQHHGFGGRMIERRYAVLQDLFRTCDMTFRWILRGPDGKRLDGGEDRQKMTSGTTHRGVLRVKLPEVKARTVCVLALDLLSDGEVVMAEERDIDVWPSFANPLRQGYAGQEATEGKPDAPVKAERLARKVVLFEGDGRTSNIQHTTLNVQGQRPKTEDRQPTTAAALAAAGIAFDRIVNLTEVKQASSPALLIIAEDVLTATNCLAVAGLAGWVEQGGRVLILRQTVTPAGLPAATQMDREHWASQCYIRAGNHPVMAGWTDWDSHFWADDRAVVRGGYSKPARGPVTPLLDSGESASREGGLEFVGLMEQYRGAGLYLLCQIPVVAKYDEEPMARELLARLVAYGGGAEALRKPTATLLALTAPMSPMALRLEAVGARVKVEGGRWKAEDRAARAVLVEASAGRGLAAEDRAALGAVLRGGATVVVSEATPADAKWLSELAGAPVTLSVPPYAAWDGRGLRSVWTPLTAGLSHFEQYYKRFDWVQSAGGQVEDTQYIIEPFQQWAVAVNGAGAVESVWPGSLVECAVGSGRLILDQRNLYAQHPELTGLAERTLSALLLGMGVRLDPPVPIRELPGAVVYRPVPLDAVANRSLTDADGSGWVGAGPEADLRTFPLKQVNLGGVPFSLAAGERQVVVLSRPEGPFGKAVPAEVRIPVGQAVEGLVFLHTAAGLESGWGGEYGIEYGDGATHVVRLESGVNIRDWTRPGALAGGRNLKVSVAWTGSTPKHPLVGVSRMTWVNPWPDRRVDAVRFALPDGHAGMPILLALTAVQARDESAGRKGKAVTPVPQRDGQGALKVAGEAEAALRVGDDGKAKRLAADALRLDPSCEAAHAVLGDLAEKAGTEDDRLAVYRAWIGAGPRHPRPFNRVGEILEQRKDYRGALDAYNRSLEVEWNQPPIIEAKSRVEKLVK